MSTFLFLVTLLSTLPSAGLSQLQIFLIPVLLVDFPCRAAVKYAHAVPSHNLRVFARCSWVSMSWAYRSVLILTPLQQADPTMALFSPTIIKDAKPLRSSIFSFIFSAHYSSLWATPKILNMLRNFCSLIIRLLFILNHLTNPSR